MTSSPPSTSSRSRTDRLLAAALGASAVVAASVVVLIVAFVALEAWPALERIGPVRFVQDGGWHPGEGRFGLLPMLLATVLTTGGALLLAVPLGVASGIFGRFYAPRSVAAWHRRAVELLAGIPSVVYGLWGLVVLVPLIARLGGSGQSLLAATLILALMILPTVALTSESALRAVPRAYLRGAAALGLGRWSTVRRVALPAARSGVVTGVLLATGRGIGETMAVLMVAGNVPAFPRGLLDPVRTLTANIALEMGYATRDHRAVLFVCGLCLMGVAVSLAGLGGFSWRGRRAGE